MQHPLNQGFVPHLSRVTWGLGDVCLFWDETYAQLLMWVWRMCCSIKDCVLESGGGSSRRGSSSTCFLCPVCPLTQLSVWICLHPATACNITNFFREDGGIFLVLCETSYLPNSLFVSAEGRKPSFPLQCPSSNHTSWTLTKSEGSGSHKTPQTWEHRPV